MWTRRRRLAEVESEHQNGGRKEIEVALNVENMVPDGLLVWVFPKLSLIHWDLHAGTTISRVSTATLSFVLKSSKPFSHNFINSESSQSRLLTPLPNEVNWSWHPKLSFSVSHRPYPTGPDFNTFLHYIQPLSHPSITHHTSIRFRSPVNLSPHHFSLSHPPLPLSLTPAVCL